jgi:hypothetical protein
MAAFTPKDAKVSGSGEDYTYSVRARKTGADGENSSKIL